MSYRVKNVVELTGIPRNTLLAWERRYSVVEPGRLDNGYRVYQDKDVARLLEVKRLIAQGHKVSEAISLLDRSRGGRDDAQGLDGVDRIREDLYTALLASNKARAERLVRGLDQLDRDDVIDKVYFPILGRVGEGWACGQISIHQEHTATRFIRERLLAMLASRPDGGVGRGLVLCARFPGEHHDVPLLALAVQLSQRGFVIEMVDVQPDSSAICAALREREPDMLCVSVMKARDTPQLVGFALEIMGSAPAGCSLVIGGRGLPLPVPQAPSRVAWHRDAEAFLSHLDGEA